MDGNNRWSKKNSIKKIDAYRKGAQKLMKISEYLFFNYNIQYISAFTLSSNNMKRSSSFFQLIKKVISESVSELENNKINFNLRIIGNIQFLGDELLERLAKLSSVKNFKKELILYLNYGGQEDIIQAAIKYRNSKKEFKNYLLTYDIPDPDLMIRTGGFSRLSNFLLFQVSFTELFFLKKMWPDLSNLDLKKIIKKFIKIDRKFGQ